MMKAEPVADPTRNTHNDLVTLSLPFDQIAYVPDSEATTIAALKDDYNALLAAIRAAGLMESAPSS